jgi:hypothetical protein
MPITEIPAKSVGNRSLFIKPKAQSSDEPTTAPGSQSESIDIVVNATSDSNIALDGSTVTVDSVDCTDELVMVNGQTDATENGIYRVHSGTAWTREATLYSGMLVRVKKGTVYKDTLWFLDSDSLVIGTDDINFHQIKDTDTDTDEKVKITANDTTEGYLKDKLVAHSDGSIILTEINDAGDETLEAQALGDHKVINDSGDGSPDYLFDKLDSARMIKLVNQTTSTLVELDNIDDLSGASLGDDLVLLTERTSDNALYKFTQDSARSWLNRLWYSEALDNDSTLALPDDTDKSITLVSLGSSNANYAKNKRCVWGYDDSKARFLGRLISIGRDGLLYSDADLIKLRGERVVVSAADYSSTLHEQCWFSILSEQAPGIGYFAISDYYGAAKQIDYVINAVFEFQYPLSGGTPATDGRWVLVNYECMVEKFWKDTDCLIAPDGDDFNIFIPNLYKFPYNGYYIFFADISIEAQWLWDSETGLPDPRQRYGMIQVQLNDADGARTIFATPNHVNTLGASALCPDPCCCKISGSHNHFMLNVSGLTRISSVDCTTRYIRIKIIKPIDYPPDTWSVDACSWSLKYMGPKKAAYCNAAATP